MDCVPSTTTLPVTTSRWCTALLVPGLIAFLTTGIRAETAAGGPAGAVWTAAVGAGEVQCLAEPSGNTFFESVRQAVLRHPGLKAASQRVAAAAAASRLSRASLLPDVALSGQAQRQQTRWPATTTHADSRNAGLTASQPLLDWNAWYAHRADANGLDAARHGFAQEYQAFVFRVTSAYLELLEARETAALSQANYALATSHLDATQKRQAAGELTRTDVDQARARAAAAEAEWFTGRAAAEVAALALAELTGEVAPGQLDLPAFPPPGGSFPDTLAAVKQNPKVLAATGRLQAAADRSRAVWAQALPVVRAQGSVFRTWGRELEGREQRADDLVAAVTVSAPVFSGGSLWAQRAAAAAYREEARAELERLRLEATRDLQATALLLPAAQAALERYEAAAAAATAAAEGVETEFQAGTATTFQVLDAQDRLFGNQLKLVQGRYAVLRAQARLLLAGGRLTLGVLEGRD